jgi:hypothetical protein
MRTVKSKPGLSHREALLSLQRHARTTNEEITSFVHQGGRWVAQLQRIAEFPPPKDEGSDEPKEPKGPPADDESDDEAPEGPPIPGDDEGGESPVPSAKDQGPEGEKGEEKGELRNLLSLVHQIADKLGIVPEGHQDKMMGDDGPAGPPPMAPAGPPPGDDPGMGSAGKDGHLPTKLHPGEVLPHQTPVGSPAFASTHTANPLPGQMAPNPTSIQQSPPCSKCGGPTVNGTCPNCTSAAGGQMGQPMMAAVQDPSRQVGNKRTITAKVDTPMTESEAWRQASAVFGPQGYKVKQLVPQRDKTWLAVLEG